VTEGSLIAAVEERGDQAGVERQPSVPERIDARVDSM
jgi:hypothetical protein